MDIIKIQVPSNPQYLPTLRLSASSVANSLEMDIDQIEDIKVIVSELYTYLMPYDDLIKLELLVNDDSLDIIFEKTNPEEGEDFSDLDFELKKQILSALSDDFKEEKDKISVRVNK